MKEKSIYTTHQTTRTSYFQFGDWSEVNGSLMIEYSKVLYIIDEMTYHHHQNQLVKLTNTIVVNSGEALKSFDGFVRLMEQIQPFELDRKSIIVSIGGGALSDLVGFVSSVYLRGISLGVIPTTLLSLVDASIGGKNGINFNQAKNQIGTIYQPKFIGVYYPFLDSLSRPELSSGFAEIVKYGVCLDADLFENLQHITLDKFIQDSEMKSKIVDRCIEIKFKIVSSDPHEQGDRKILNFGHSIGHSLESVYSLSHGQAVSLGMILALRISEAECGLEHTQVNKVMSLLSKFELPVKLDFDPSIVYSKLINDKKRDRDQIEFILIPTIGSAVRKWISIAKIHSYLIQAKTELWI